jgi:hypothetical protein
MKNYKLLSNSDSCWVLTFAQPGKFKEKKRSECLSLKVAYITSELQLTPDESAKFWPVYNEFEQSNGLKEIR